MGTVFRAERVKLGRAVAIKFLQPGFARQPDFVKRFEREALAMSRIYHHHCVSIIDYGMYQDSPYLVMEYVPGRSLARILRDGPLPPARAVRIAQQVLDTLGYFHRRNVLHRDLKAENIMIAGDEDEDDFVKLLDFGMAKLLSGVGADISVSTKGVLIGTPSAMSPEQIRELALDARSDLYSTGVLLYHMLTGKRPFQGDDMVAVFKMHLEKPVTPPSEILGTRAISKELDAVVLKALAKDRDQRFGDARAMAEALAATREGREQERRPSTIGSMTMPAVRRRTGLAYGGWAVAAVLGAVLAVQQLRGGRGAGGASAPVAAPDAASAAPPMASDAADVAPADDAGIADAAAEVIADAASPAAVAPMVADAGVADARAAPPWSAALADARARIGHGDHHGAMRAIAAAARTWPEARGDREVLDAALATLAAPDGDQHIPLLLRDLGGPALIDALSAAVTGAAPWYERHHAWFALQQAGHLDRADRVGMWIVDFERADSCKATQRARASMEGSRDPRVLALLAALADGKDPRYATQRACLAGAPP
jgi:Protein kinase domain